MGLLRAEQVAEMLACSRAQVYALKDSGKLPYCKIGGMVRFRPEDVEELIQTNLWSQSDRAFVRATVPRLKHLRA